MPGDSGYIDEEEWREVVENVPIVSVDLILKTDGGVVLGKRLNEPAEGEWFVPGGRVHKNERLREAVHRVANEELGVEIEIEDELGVYEHFYDEADVSGLSKHYVTVGYVVGLTGEQDLVPDDQHSELCVFREPPEDLHPYVSNYMEDSGVFSSGN